MKKKNVVVKKKEKDLYPTDDNLFPFSLKKKWKIHMKTEIVFFCFCVWVEYTTRTVNKDWKICAFYWWKTYKSDFSYGKEKIVGKFILIKWKKVKENRRKRGFIEFFLNFIYQNYTALEWFLHHHLERLFSCIALC